MKSISKKVCLLGDFAVGKTSLVRRFVYDLFDDKYISTIGVKVSRKTVVIPGKDEMVELAMMLWDLAGSEEFDRVRTSYVRGASGAVLVCDFTRPGTLHNLRSYADDLLSVSPGAQIIVAANKRDLLASEPDGQASYLEPDLVEEVAHSLRAPCYLTSAKTGTEVEEMFRQLGLLLIT
jgi:small GTP-binding protein